VAFVGIDDVLAFFNGYSGIQMSIEVAIMIIFFYTCIAITCTYVLAVNHFNEIKDAIKEAKRNEGI
jgi:archaellum component FlaF (FlaF/FlaG flagellin family)